MNTYKLLQVLQDIRDRMKRHKLVDLASASGLSVPTVRGIRNGVNYNPSIESICKIADTLDSIEGVEHE